MTAHQLATLDRAIIGLLAATGEDIDERPRELLRGWIAELAELSNDAHDAPADEKPVTS